MAIWDRALNGNVIQRHEAEINERRIMFDVRRTRRMTGRGA